MVRWLGILIRTLRSTVGTHRELALENLAFRQQLAVWKARQPRPRLTALDRIFFSGSCCPGSGRAGGRCSAWAGSITDTSGERREPIGRISGRHRLGALVTLRCVDDARTKKFRNALRRVAEQVAEYIARVLPDAIRGGPPGVERLAIDVVRAGGHPDGTPGGV